ncbi:acyl-CoA dehydrogenase family protein [Streptomyces tubbatahanensis]|uniref:Acyl-CoA dehydrogenase family protein n=1 Tax=Streptomyces tubbatahanensis TaxID=2923272 RepID=A0ABY3XT17_9ACTN|nr:acyl-CoA dehydrogenase family protein [Streptomyces tubbatahanensis]UNS97545.1 acyl-CoA dehydrogenase family protein [Streptomyces tubbatahanensis]
MDTGFTAEQNAIRRTLRHVLDRHSGPDEVRAAARSPQGYDTALWATLARDHGLPGLAVPQAYGGAGRGALALALAGEETGRALLPSPLVPTACLVAPLVLALGTEAQRTRVLPRLASGELTGALAVPPGTLPVALGLTVSAGPGERAGREHCPGEEPADNGRADSGRPDSGRPVGGWSGGGRAGGIQAHRAADGWRLYGEAAQVLGGHSAGLLLVAAHTGGFTRSRTLLFLVPDDAAGLVRVRHSALDETRPVARVELRDVRAELLGERDEHDVRPALAALGPRVAAVLAMEAVGAADGALARTVEQVTSGAGAGRRPCGSLRAIRTLLAEAYLRVRTARAAASYAAWTVGADEAWTAATDEAEARAAAGGAQASGLEALRFAAGEAMRLHGEAGSTREQTAPLSFRRAAGDDLLFGPVHRLRHQAAEEAALYAAGAGPEGAADVREGNVARTGAQQAPVARTDAQAGPVA